MSVMQDGGLGPINPHNLPDGFSKHYEPPKVGGKAYWRCDHCGAESIYFKSRDLQSELVHKDGCDNPVVGGGE